MGGKFVDRGDPLEEAASLGLASFAVEDSVLKGLGVRATPGAAGGQVLIEPGGVGGEVTLAGSHLVYAAG